MNYLLCVERNGENVIGLGDTLKLLRATTPEQAISEAWDFIQQETKDVKWDYQFKSATIYEVNRQLSLNVDDYYGALKKGS